MVIFEQRREIKNMGDDEHEAEIFVREHKNFFKTPKN